ncbi:hypothetical protein J2Z21_004672 [Streptomyces griseochromogenes]|uniref:Uncharacterized protein n=1 Tax=Streptomyces griseochromogenes TaxID=68214 RepID=A0A1B1ATD8_9ACTN|nr:hypothetical protein [Streptomyces griseochromogenes]ANP49815.1 hypothetical protein AVL59_09500 [Streptomyces griseochromogenes]MBP2051695.1 hypothetical protein [Streptomyces griseochromogenes]
MGELLDPSYGVPDLSEPRLPLFTPAEAHELLDVLQHFGTTDHDWGARARHFAAELAVRLPSVDA